MKPVYRVTMQLTREGEPDVLRTTSARLHVGEIEAFEYMMMIRAKEFIKDAQWYEAKK